MRSSCSFPFGTAALRILVMAVLSGGGLAVPPSRKNTTALTSWVFAPEHQQTYVEAVSSFEAMHPGVKVDVQLVAPQAVTTRLQVAFWSDLDVPDLVEAPIDFAGSFFRGSLENIGFADLTTRIHQAG